MFIVSSLYVCLSVFSLSDSECSRPLQRQVRPEPRARDMGYIIKLYWSLETSLNTSFHLKITKHVFWKRNRNGLKKSSNRIGCGCHVSMQHKLNLQMSHNSIATYYDSLCQTTSGDGSINAACAHNKSTKPVLDSLLQFRHDLKSQNTSYT